MHRRNLAKILGLALLAAVGVMAVSASAAQAKWLFLKEGEGSPSLLKFNITGLLGELLVPESKLAIHCTGATGTATVHDDGTGEASGTFHGCTVLGDEQCTIYPEEEEEGTPGDIPASGTGKLEMSGEGEEEEVYITAEGKPFAVWYFGGMFCTLPEEVEVNGLARIDILDASTLAKVHLVHVDEGRDSEGNTELFYGKEPAELHGKLLEGEKHEPAVEAHVEEFSGAPTALHLVE